MYVLCTSTLPAPPGTKLILYVPFATLSLASVKYVPVLVNVLPINCAFVTTLPLTLALPVIFTLPDDSSNVNAALPTKYELPLA